MKKIAIIGANEFQADIISKAKSLGHETHVFSWGGGEIGEILADHFYKISITEKEKILSICREIGVDAVCSIASDLANITVHWVARELGLRAHSSTCIENTTNKFSMRNTLSHHKQPIPFYKLISSISDVDETTFQYPAIVKPIDRSGSRGITKVYNRSELLDAINFAKEVSFSDRVLVEEFVDGREFSIEAISCNGKHKVLQITEKFTTSSPNYIEVAHLAPARLTPSQSRDIEIIVINALTALGVEFGPSHSEVKLNSNGVVKIIEIGSRMGGDFIGSYLVEQSTGVDFVALTLALSLGEELDIGNISTNISDDLSSMIYYQVKKENIDLTKHPRVKTLEFIPNRFFNDNVSCSNERYSCSKLLINNKSLKDIISLIEKEHDKI